MAVIGSNLVFFLIYGFFKMDMSLSELRETVKDREA